ncbi:hypothetical protein [Haloglycomyces albus]|uniref:hypothetical protein n=1 Tax=Haloglycomyces albus TaxID=526067 RepID=UPI00046CF39B|nr:hypothetical protein [Haloglycomyces albus]
MDIFSRTMLAASAEAGIVSSQLTRHLPYLRLNVSPQDRVILVTQLIGSGGYASGEHILMLTGRRLVITRQSRLLNRVRAVLDAPVNEIESMRWSAIPNRPGVELSFVAGGEHFHFWLPTSHPKRMWRIDAHLALVFRRPGVECIPLPKSVIPTQRETMPLSARRPERAPSRRSHSSATLRRTKTVVSLAEALNGPRHD